MLAAAASATTPLEVVAALDAQFVKLYNSQKFSELAEKYGENALLVPPTGDDFIPRSAIEGFFSDGYAHGLTDLSLTPLHVEQPSTDVLLEVGNVSHSLQPAGGAYHVRWEKDAAGEWKVALDILSIGAPAPAPTMLAAAARDDVEIAALKPVSPGMATSSCGNY